MTFAIISAPLVATAFSLPGLLDGAGKLLIYVVILGVLILFHELGHMVAAKRAGVTVSEFAFGFGPRLFGIERGGTLYTINLLPLGGFCRMVGEDTADDGSADPGNFQHKPLWKRFGIILAGPVFNFVLAAVLFVIIGVGIGQPVATNVVDYVQPGTPAAAAHLQPGDEIVGLDGNSFRSGDEIMTYIHGHPNKLVAVDVRRGSAIEHLKIKTAYGDIGNGQKAGKFGYIARLMPQRMPFFQGLLWGIGMVPQTIAFQWFGLMTVIAHHDASALAGPVGIARIVSTYASEGIEALLAITAQLSVVLGMFNLFPVPALDGGRLAFMIVEFVRGGRRVDPEKEGLVHLTGFALLMVFIAFVTYHDIAQWISGKGPI